MAWVLTALASLLVLALYGMASSGRLKDVSDTQLNWFFLVILVMGVLAEALFQLNSIAKSLKKLAEKENK